MAKLTASDGAASDDFGVSSAISGDIVVVGAFDASIATTVEQGDAYKRALESAFDLAYTPRFELWVHRDDEIVRY